MFNLTQEERKVILFLAAVALLGLGADFLAKKFGRVKSVACFGQNLGKVNLNAADKKMLMGISGIGEKLAQRIIEYREARVSFSSLEQLKEVKGITDSKYAKIKEYLIAQ